MYDYQELETVVNEILTIFDVNTPPVPVESMLQKPVNDMWDEVDVTQLSGSFLRLNDQYSPRMSMARLLARHIIFSEWANTHNISHLQEDVDGIRAFARMVIMPRVMVQDMSAGARTPTTMRLHFEVPEADARKRLEELALYS
ncbi:MAG: hypothetical protein AAF787_15080 [Chloroflexota bacterium]